MNDDMDPEQALIDKETIDIYHNPTHGEIFKKGHETFKKNIHEPLLAEIANVLCHVAQLIDGWNHDGTWSEWDQSVRDEVGRLQKKLDSTDNSAKGEG